MLSSISDCLPISREKFADLRILTINTINQTKKNKNLPQYRAFPVHGNFLRTCSSGNLEFGGSICLHQNKQTIWHEKQNQSLVV